MMSFFTSSLIAQNLVWTAIDINRNGKFLSVANDNGSVLILSFPECSLKEELREDSIYYTQTRWNPKQDIVASCGYSIRKGGAYSNITMYDLAKRNLYFMGENLEGGEDLAWDREGKLLAMAGRENGYIMVFNEEGIKINHLAHPSKKRLSSVAFNPVTDQLAATETDVRIYDLKGNKEISRLRNGNFRKNIPCLEWNPEGTLLAGADQGHETDNENSYLTIWDNSGNQLARVKDSPDPYFDLEWSPNGREIATVSEALRIWSFNGKLIETVDFGMPLKGVCWTPDGKKLIVCGDNMMVGVWNRKTKKIIFRKNSL